jgi:hypothetical protein
MHGHCGHHLRFPGEILGDQFGELDGIVRLFAGEKKIQL